MLLMDDSSEVTNEATIDCPHRRVHHHYETVEKETHPHSYRHHPDDKNRTLRLLRPRQPPPPSQFVIEKQGRFEESLWHTRVFTLDAARHRLFLSKSKKEEELYYRCMVRIDVVQMWPTFNSSRINEDFESDAARRTVCIKGLVGVRPSTFFGATRLFGPSANGMASGSLLGRFFGGKEALLAEQAEITAAQVAAAKHRDLLLAPVPDTNARGGNCGGPRSVDIKDFTDFITEVWVIRAMTVEDLRQLARAVRRTLPDTCAVTGYHRAVAGAVPTE